MALIVGVTIGLFILPTVVVLASCMLSSRIDETESREEEWRALQARAEMRRIRAQEKAEQALPGTTTRLSSNI